MKSIIILIMLVVCAQAQLEKKVRPQDLTPETKTLIADSAKAVWNDSVGVLETRALNSAKSAISDTATQLRSEMASPATISDTTTATVRKTVDAQTAWTDDSNDSVYVPDGSTITNSGRTLQVGTIDTSNFNAAIRAYIAKEIRKGILSGLAGQDTTGYWVAKDGNDSNAGNYSYPWLTLEKADATVAAGGTIHVKAGTYIEDDGGCLTLSDKQLYWTAEGKVIVGAAGTSYVVNSTSTDTMFFDGFTFDAGDSVEIVIYKNIAGSLKFTDCKFYSQCDSANSRGIYSLGAGALLLDNCYADFDSVDYGIEIRSAVANRIENSTLNFGATVPVSIYSHPTAGSLTMRNVTINSSSATTFSNASAFDWTLAQSRVTVGTITSLFTNSSQTDATVKIDTCNITATRTTNSLMLAVPTDSVIYYLRGNTITVTSLAQDDEIIEIRNALSYYIQNNTLNILSTTAGATPIYLYTTSRIADSTNVSGNIIKTRGATGYAIAIGTEGTTGQNNYLDSAVVHNNIIYGPAYYSGSLTGVTIHGIFVGFNKDASIKYNKVYGCGYGVVDKGSNTKGGTIAYNVITDCWQGVRVKGDTATVIYNNSFYHDIDFESTAIYLSNNAGSDGAINCIIKNNSIQTKTASAQSSYGILIDAASSSGQTIDYNLIKLSSGYIGGYNGATKTWATWQALGFDANGINSDPLYLVPESNKLKLTSRSPGINAGTDVSETVDIDGNAISGNPDIGAYEKQ